MPGTHYLRWDGCWAGRPSGQIGAERADGRGGQTKADRRKDTPFQSPADNLAPKLRPGRENLHSHVNPLQIVVMKRMDSLRYTVISVIQKCVTIVTRRPDFRKLQPASQNRGNFGRDKRTVHNFGDPGCH